MDFKYVDLVVCRFPDDDRDFLFCAPRWSGLEAGDQVVAETDGGNRVAQVQAVCTIDIGDNNIVSMILYLAKVEKPLHRVLSKVVFSDFEYEEDEDDSV